MKDLATATRKARDLFGSAVMHVSAVPDFRGRPRAHRVTMPGNVLHWLSSRGRHESEYCCPTAKQRQGRQDFSEVEVLRK